MRMLSVREVEFVSGGDDVQIPDVEITATRIKDNWDWLTLNYFLDSFSKSWDEFKNSWAEIADLFDRDNALFSASTNNSLEQWAGALAAMSGAVTGNNPNMAADMHYLANKQGYGLALDSALKGVLDKVRGGP